MTTRSTHIIVGSGKAGTAAAFSMRAGGFAGEIVLLDDEDMIPYDRPPLSKEILNGPDPSSRPLYRPEKYAEAEIKLMPGRAAVELDLKTGRIALSDGTHFGFDRLLLATGARSRRLHMRGSEHIRYLRTYADALVLRNELYRARSVVCIGAGVIGLEIAAAARALGAQTTVVELGSEVMARCLASSEAEFVKQLHIRNGVDIRLGAHIECISAKDTDGRHLVSLSDGTDLVADCIVAGVGMERNTQLGDTAGIASENGHLVDACGRTSHEAVFAAGDVAALLHPLYSSRLRLESWHHAQGHGAAVGRAMCDGETEYRDIPRFWSDQFSANIQVAGLPREAVETVLRGNRQEESFTAFHLSDDGGVVAATAVNCARNMRPAMMLVAARAHPSPSQLADPTCALMSLAQAASAQADS